MTLSDSTRAALDNARRQLSQTVVRKSADKTDTTIRYTTATGFNEIYGQQYRALLPVTTGDWTAYIQEGADRLILGPARTDGGIDIDGVSVAICDDGTYTPTLDNVTLGTTGSLNTCVWRYHGRAAGKGTLSLTGYFTLGTGGSMGTSPAISLPDGYQVDCPQNTVNFRFPGSVSMTVAGSGVAYFGLVQKSTTDNTKVGLIGQWGLLPPRSALITATEPATWTAGDSIRYTAQLPVVRG